MSNLNNPFLTPIKTASVKEECVARFEEAILSGQVDVGEKLPSERDLAARLHVGRPVIHEALVELASKGLVRLVPRQGAFVNDFHIHGSINLMTALFNYRTEIFTPKLMEDFLEMRMLIEVESAGLAAVNRSENQVEFLQDTLNAEKAASPDEAAELAHLNFELHHQIAMATGNLIYSLLINSIKTLYLNFSEKYYERKVDNLEALKLKQALIDAVVGRKKELARLAMRNLLKHDDLRLWLLPVQCTNLDENGGLAERAMAANS